MEWITGSTAAALFGLVGGVLMGLAARKARFCTLGAIEDALYAGDLARIRMWALALAGAILGTHLLATAGFVDLSQTIYARAGWNPVASVLGGLMFGYGMAIAGNCGFGALARLGGGDLRSLVIVVVTGVAAYAFITGPLSGLRLALFPPAGVDGAGALSLPAIVLPGTAIGGVLPFAIVAALAAWALSDERFRASQGMIGWSLAVSIAIVAGWASTAYLARTSFDVVPLESHTFTAPLGETVLFLMVGASTDLAFPLGSVVGVVLGALFGSMSRGQFRWEACDDPGELRRQIAGGALMGIGGVLALGCSIGQGMTAFSALSLSAPVVLASIFAGAALGLRHLIRGYEPAE